MQQPLPNNNYNPQPSFNQNYVQQTMINLDNISDPTIAMTLALTIMAKAFKLSTPTNNNKRISSNPRSRQIAQPGMNVGQDRHIQNNPGVQNVGNQNGLIVFPRIQHPNGNQNGTENVVAAQAEGTGYGYNDNQISQLLIAQKEEAKIQLQAEEYDLMSVVADIDEIEEVNANCILMANLQQASTFGTQTVKAPIYDSDDSAENNSDVITAAPSVEQSGGIVEQHLYCEGNSMGSNEETNAAGTDTRPPMLVESDYDSWKIRIHRYIRGKPNGKLIWKSIQNRPTPHPMNTDPPTTDSAAMPAPRKKLDSEFSEEENKLEMADTQAEIILSQGRTIHQKEGNLLMCTKGFRAIGNESIHYYFVRFHKLVNDIKITQLNIPTHQMNTKFVNNLLAYWGKYVTNVKQNMDISTTPYVQT
ncbi:hypothetical protein Tco_0206869 [Tanacetum coccineum]